MPFTKIKSEAQEIGYSALWWSAEMASLSMIYNDQKYYDLSVRFQSLYYKMKSIQKITDAENSIFAKKCAIFVGRSR